MQYRFLTAMKSASPRTIEDFILLDLDVLAKVRAALGSAPIESKCAKQVKTEEKYRLEHSMIFRAAGYAWPPPNPMDIGEGFQFKTIGLSRRKQV